MRILKRFSGFVGGLAFVADLITLADFIYDSFFSEHPLPVESLQRHGSIIIIVFVFAVCLVRYAKNEAEGFEWIWSLFSWIYVLFAAVILAFVVYRYLRGVDVALEWVGVNLILVTLTAGLGFIVMALTSKTKLIYFAAPFMLVALEHIVLWVVNVITAELVLFDMKFCYEVLLFLYTGTMITMVLRFQRAKGRAGAEQATVVHQLVDDLRRKKGA